MPYFTSFQKQFDVNGSFSFNGLLPASPRTPANFTLIKDITGIYKPITKEFSYYQSLYILEYTFDYNIVATFPTLTSHEMIIIRFLPTDLTQKGSFFSFPIGFDSIGETDIQRASGNININGTSKKESMGQILNVTNASDHNFKFNLMINSSQDFGGTGDPTVNMTLSNFVMHKKRNFLR